MTPNLRRQSFRIFIGWWLTGVGLTAVVIGSLPIGSAHAQVATGPLLFSAYLFLPFIVFTWIRFEFLWGFGLTTFASLLITVAALSSREFSLLWLPLGLITVGGLARKVLARWGNLSQTDVIQEEKLEGDLNAVCDERRHLEENLDSFHERLARYQRLRQVANAFSTTLSLEELIQGIVRVTGHIIEQSTLVLLYLVDSKLALELKAVWRRKGNVTIKAKAGDPFDLWVMRQAQPLLVQEMGHDFRFPQMDDQKLGRSVGSVLAVPLASEHRFIGVLRVEAAHPKELGPEELRVCRIIGDLASLAIENARLYQRMEELSITDDLTGLHLRRYFEKRLEEEMVRAGQAQGKISVLLIDIDRFKEYNDTFGHSAGDKLLKEIAGLLKQTCRPTEVAARLGGEEFSCLLPGVSLIEAGERAEQIRCQVESAQIKLRRALTPTTVSVGVAAFPEDGQTGVGLLQKADERLYRAKSQGRNRVCTV